MEDEDEYEHDKKHADEHEGGDRDADGYDTYNK